MSVRQAIIDNLWIGMFIWAGLFVVTQYLCRQVAENVEYAAAIAAIYDKAGIPHDGTYDIRMQYKNVLALPTYWVVGVVMGFCALGFYLM